MQTKRNQDIGCEENFIDNSLCHQINLTHVDISIDLQDDFAHVFCRVKTREGLDRNGSIDWSYCLMFDVA